jgi:hypothetical protein
MPLHVVRGGPNEGPTHPVRDYALLAILRRDRRPPQRPAPRRPSPRAESSRHGPPGDSGSPAAEAVGRPGADSVPVGCAGPRQLAVRTVRRAILARHRPRRRGRFLRVRARQEEGPIAQGHRVSVRPSALSDFKRPSWYHINGFVQALNYRRPKHVVPGMHPREAGRPPGPDHPPQAPCPERLGPPGRVRRAGGLGHRGDSHSWGRRRVPRRPRLASKNTRGADEAGAGPSPGRQCSALWSSGLPI